MELADNDEWVDLVTTDDYVGQRAEGMHLTDVVARGGRWSGVTFEALRAMDVLFENCDLAGVAFMEDSSLLRVTFRDCRLTGAVFAGARLRSVRFENSTLDDANFRMADAEDVAIDGGSLVGADFYAAKLTAATLAGADLRGADFTKATLRDVDLRSSRLEDIVGADALRGVTIDSRQIVPLARSLAVAMDIKILDDDAGA